MTPKGPVAAAARQQGVPGCQTHSNFPGRVHNLKNVNDLIKTD